MPLEATQDAAFTDDQPISDVVDGLLSLSSADQVSYSDILKQFGQTAFLPLLMVPALLVVTPLSGIPLFSSLCGLTIALIAAQMLVGRSELWLPSAIATRTIEGRKISRFLDRFRGLAGWIDRRTERRIAVLNSIPVQKLVQLLCVFAGLSMPLLEVVPLSSSLLGCAVLLFASSMLTRDGVLFLSGLFLYSTAMAIPMMAVSQI